MLFSYLQPVNNQFNIMNCIPGNLHFWYKIFYFTICNAELGETGQAKAALAKIRSSYPQFPGITLDDMFEYDVILDRISQDVPFYRAMLKLLERHGHLYVPRRDPRYLRRNALIALGNAGGEEARALAAPFARSGDPVLAPPAQRVLDSY